MRSAHRDMIIIALLCGFAIALYVPTLPFPFAPFDDKELIQQNPIVREFTAHTFSQAFTTFDPELYIPFTIVSFQLNRLMSPEAWSFRLVNILLHVINGSLLYLLFARTTRNRRIAALSAAIFVVHPLSMMTVPWATGRKDVLSALFFLSSALAYIRYLDTRFRRWEWCSLLCFLCGLLSKISILLLPLFLLILHAQHERPQRHTLWRSILPFAALSGTFFIIARMGKEPIMSRVPLSSMFIMAPRSLLYYIQSFLYPIQLHVHAPTTAEPVLRSPHFFLPILLTFLIAGVFLWKGIRRRMVLLATGLFLLPVIPSFVNYSTANITYIGSARHVYLGMGGLAMLLAACIEKLRVQHWTDSWRTALRTCSACTLVIILALLSARQSRIWQSPVTFFRTLHAYYPSSTASTFFLGSAYVEEGQRDVGMTYLREAIRASPHDWRFHYALACALRDSGRKDEALGEFSQAIQYNPHVRDPYFARMNILMQKSQWKQARDVLLEYLTINPSDPVGLMDLGVLNGKLGETRKEISLYRQSLAIDPHLREARLNLAAALARNGDAREALAQLRILTEEDPSFVQDHVQSDDPLI